MIYDAVRHGQRGVRPSPREGDSSALRVGRCQSTFASLGEAGLALFQQQEC